MAEEHRHTVEEVVLGGKHLGFADAVPVETGAHQRLGEVEVGLVVGPLALALHTSSNSVVADGLLLVTHLEQFPGTLHQVADNHHALHGELPVLILLFAILALTLAVVGGHGHTWEERTILVVVVSLVGLAILLDPNHGTFELLGIVDAEIDTAQDLDERDILGAHTKILLQEIGIDNRTGNAHTGVTKAQIRLAAHGGYCLCCTGKTKNLLSHIGRDGVVGKVLYIVTINAIGRQTLLSVCCKDRSQIDCTRTFGAIEAPDGLWMCGIHVHGFGSIAPATGNGDGCSDAFTLELLGAGCTFAHTADGGVADNALHRTAVAVAEV